MECKTARTSLNTGLEGDSVNDPLPTAPLVL